jgi:hypothetical protein
MGDCFVPRSDISFGLLEKTFLDSYTLLTKERLPNSPYAERPEGFRKSTLFLLQTFGTARNISV